MPQGMQILKESSFCVARSWDERLTVVEAVDYHLSTEIVNGQVIFMQRCNRIIIIIISYIVIMMYYTCINLCIILRVCMKTLWHVTTSTA